MKVADSQTAFASRHLAYSQRSSSVHIRAWVGDRRPDSGQTGTANAQQSSFRLSISAAAWAQLGREAASRPGVRAGWAQDVGQARGAEKTEAAADTGPSDPRMRLLADMIEAVTGEVVQVFDARRLEAGGAATVESPAAAPADAGTAQPPAPAGWGVEVDSRERVVESEVTQVSASGVVRTADGQEFRFELRLEMSRAFVQESTASLRAGDAVRKDPLILNFQGGAPELADVQFRFDLQGDGQQRDIALPTGGTAFLMLDRNRDGVLNNGLELFGTRSGDGFADLAQLDQDGNQWIDENDPAYQQLRVWQQGANGQAEMATLAEKSVGALYVGRVSSPFSVRTEDNRALGQVRSTGVFLYESGQAGALQQVDL